MPFTPPFSAALSAAALLFQLSGASQVLNFCVDNECSNCPVAPGQAVGYPECNVYDSKTVLGSYGFTGVAGGGFQTWVDVPQPDSGCTVIIRSPAGVDQENCGVPVGAFKQATCANVPLKESFMLQYCCGSGDCGSAGVGARGTDGLFLDRRAAGTGFKFYDANGKEIEPIESGSPPSASKLKERKEAAAAAAAAKRAAEAPAKREPKVEKRSCSGWTNTGDVYTKNALDFQIVQTGVNGGTTGSTVTVTTERSVSVESSFNLGLSDIVSLGVSVATTETTSSSKSVQEPIPAGSTGELAFTPILKCQDGTTKCDGTETTGSVCGGYKQGDDVAGTYSVVAVTKKQK